jgi:O-antigen/teichoic acid export membrane protein
VFGSIILNLFLNYFFLKLCPEILKGNTLVFMQDFVLSFYQSGDTVFYIFFSNLLANSIFIILILKDLFFLRFKLEKKTLSNMLGYAAPLLFLGIAGMVNELLDRILLKEFLPRDFYEGVHWLEAVGIYGACYKLAIFITLANMAFRYAAEPFFFSTAQEKNAKSTYSKVMRWYIIFMIQAVVYVSLFRKEFATILITDPFYHQGLFIVPILLYANLFLGIYFNQSIWYKLTDRTIWGTYIGIFGAALTIALNIILIPIIGYLGSAVTTLICYFSMSLFSYFKGQKVYPVPYNLSSAAFYIILSLAFVLVSYADLGMGIKPFFIKLGLALLFSAITLWREKGKIRSLSQ